MIRSAHKCFLLFVLICGAAIAAEATIVERAQKGEASAQFDLGVMYANGIDVPKDNSEAMKWYRKAAEQGFALAQACLGLMYGNGDGVAKDSTEAVKWYRKAAEQGFAVAQFGLGFAYANGDGVAKDSIEAAKWYRKAAEQGLDHAQFRLGVMYNLGEGVLKDSSEAMKWYRKAAEQGFADAQVDIGLMYSNGVGARKDSIEAVKWYRKAALLGHASAQFNLGVKYASGDGVAKNSTEAVKWWHKAAEQGLALAQFNLGNSYAHGDGILKDSTEAVKWYHRAAEQGDTWAQGNLGRMYANGEGVPKDTIEGLAWSNIAAASGSDIDVKTRDVLERRLGAEATLIAQHRSKEILKEIEAAKRAATLAIPKDSARTFSPATELPKVSGSGTIVATQGYVLTAAHVVAGASRVKIFTAQGMKTATVVRIDEANDLAVLKLADGTYPALQVVPSRRIRLGQSVATIGFPNVEIQGFSPKVTKGEISSLNGIGDDPRAWQISVPVQPGNSGGALLDENGNVIGVVVSKLGLKALKATGDIPQNVNYAVKSTYALALLEPYLESIAPEPNQAAGKPRFEDMIAKAQQSVVLILVY